MSKFLPEKRRGKTNRAVCIQVDAEPQSHSLACGSQHTVPALTSPKINTLKTRPPQPESGIGEGKKSLDLNSINLSRIHYFCVRVLGRFKSFHPLVTCVGVVAFDAMLGLSPVFVSEQDWVENEVKRPKIGLL